MSNISFASKVEEQKKKDRKFYVLLITLLHKILTKKLSFRRKIKVEKENEEENFFKDTKPNVNSVLH